MAELEKAVWTDDDFERMGWHDATVHGIGFVEGEKPWLGRLLLDIDYIVDWLAPHPSSSTFSFQVAPATLVFEEVIGISLNLSAESVTFGVALQILGIHRSLAKAKALTPTHFEYRIRGVDFELHFAAARFHQYLRARPIPSHRQMLSAAQRGQPSFAIDTSSSG
jgi:hypothetical protein